MNVSNAAWTAFETAQGSNGDIIAEHKDINDNSQTINIKHHKSPKAPAPKPGKNVVVNKTVTKSNTTTTPGSSTTTPGNSTTSTTTTNRPGFATTGGNDKVSHNWFYNWLYKWFN